MITSKLLIPSIGAAAMATALGLFMIKLIHVEFEAEVEKEVVVFEAEIIHTPTIKPHRTKLPVRTKKIEVPPRIDLIEVDQVSIPSEPLYTGPANGPDLTLPPLVLEATDTGSPDTAAQPIVRLVAKVPDKALREGRSGYCSMRFDVNPKGQPFNVKAYNCSHGMFEKNSVRATLGFKYLPKIKGGVPVTMTGVETRIVYEVRDENGKLLPS